MTHLTNEANWDLDMGGAEKLSFRKIAEEDMSFLTELYATTRAKEMAMVPWTDEEKNNFIKMQFNAQHTFYQEQFRDAEFYIVELGETDIGRLYLDRRDHEIRIIDIALLPEHQGKGVGSRLLSNIINDAKQDKLAVTIHVEKNNPAMSLYKRLGFEFLEDQGVYDLLRWSVESCEP